MGQWSKTYALVQAWFSRQYVKETVAPKNNLVQGMNSIFPFKILRLLNDVFYPKTAAIFHCTHWIYCSFVLYYPNLTRINSILWTSIFLDSEASRQDFSKVSSNTRSVQMAASFSFWDTLSYKAFTIKKPVKVSAQISSDRSKGDFKQIENNTQMGRALSIGKQPLIYFLFFPIF